MLLLTLGLLLLAQRLDQVAVQFLGQLYLVLELFAVLVRYREDLGGGGPVVGGLGAAQRAAAVRVRRLVQRFAQLFQLTLVLAGLLKKSKRNRIRVRAEMGSLIESTKYLLYFLLILFLQLIQLALVLEPGPV